MQYDKSSKMEELCNQYLAPLFFDGITWTRDYETNCLGGTDAIIKSTKIDFKYRIPTKRVPYPDFCLEYSQENGKTWCNMTHWDVRVCFFWFLRDGSCLPRIYHMQYVCDMLKDKKPSYRSDTGTFVRYISYYDMIHAEDTYSQSTLITKVPTNLQIHRALNIIRNKENYK